MIGDRFTLALKGVDLTAEQAAARKSVPTNSNCILTLLYVGDGNVSNNLEQGGVGMISRAPGSFMYLFSPDPDLKGRIAFSGGAEASRIIPIPAIKRIVHDVCVS